MADIRYVVLSDLHFGACNSVLTALVPDPGSPGGFRAAPTTPSPVLVSTLASLRALTADQPTRPTLVLAGDILDLALSPDEVAGAAFEGFVDLALSDRAPDGPLFAPTVYFLPGNHDHHLWEAARESQYVAYLRDLPADQAIRPPWHTTRLLPDRQPPVSEADLLTTLIRRRPGCGAVVVQVVYPNLALVTDDGRRALVISHGHFTEPIYTLMSQLRETLFPDQPADRLIDTLERENFAWIDFFWSTLGRSGQVGVDVGLVYADLTSAADIDLLAGRLIEAAFRSSHSPPWLRRVELAAARAVVRREARHLARSERGTPDVALTDKSRQGLRSYLEGPVHHQLVDDLGAVPPEMGFVFGHTHKPFVERWSVAGYGGLVTVANTGGWVVDTVAPAPAQGGAPVLVDERLNTAALQVYGQAAHGGSDPPAVLVATDAPDGANPLEAEMIGALDPGGPIWSAVTAAATAAVRQRHALQGALMDMARSRRTANRRR